ncbi:MAG: 1-acyl-sn-glycerol-3-phosphate acyltransferase [Chitinophagaceae bacterium]|nr:1-acyl-sn-glycerol-3-phosphate acyltransferase [Chitinophagaceae bacterium]
MKLLKNILARFFAFWALVTFMSTFLLFYIPSMLCWLMPGRRGQAIFIGIARIWISIWLPLAGCRFRIRGKEHFAKGKTFVVTCNHNSLLDPPLSSPFIPGPNKTIAKSSLKKVPLFGLYLMKGGVMVNRKDEISRRRSYEKMKDVLAGGVHMCIYPEGTRNRTPEPLKKFHDGAFRLAADTGNSIIPAVILGTKKVLPANKPFWFWPGLIQLHFLPPVSSVGKTKDQLKEEVFDIMAAYYTANEKR